MHPHFPPPRRQRGFTLVELMIAIAIGLFILAGMTTLFVKNSRAQGEIEKSNRQIENGRFAIETLSSDLRNAGFYGEFNPTVLTDPAARPDPCATALATIKTGMALHVQGLDNAAANALACLTGLRAGTDILVVRRTRTCVAGDPGCDALTDGGPYFQASLCNNPSELGSGSNDDFYGISFDASTLNRHQKDCTQTAGSGTLADIRRYDTHIYYIASNDNNGDGIPTLKRAELSSTGGAASFTVVPLVEGIDNLQLEYGLDTDGDGAADTYSANPATAAGCATEACAVTNWRNVVAVKVNLLARNVDASAEYTDNKSYVLGNTAAGTPNQIAAAGDHYKRHVFQATVGLPNAAGRKIP